MLKLFKCCLLVVLFANLPLQAATPSPAMLEQFKKLSPAEQQRLAKQYGIELPQISADHINQPEPHLLVQAESAKAATEAEAKKPETVQTPKASTAPNERFGINLFNSSVSTFAPIDNAPVPENYRLGPSDELLVQLYGKQNTSHHLLISRDGSVNVPDVGPLHIAGLTVVEASDLIKAQIEQAMIGVQAAVNMGKLRTINIIVAGEARTPGMYAVSALTTVTQALFVSGGVTQIGSLRDIQVKRNGATVREFDLYQLLLKGDSGNDIALQHGDVVFVPPLKATVTVEGEVNRPAIYEVKSGESIEQLLAMAGGTKAGAYPQSVVLERFGSNNLRNLTNLDLTQSVNRQIPLRNGDLLRIPLTSPRVENLVTLAGAVIRPGFYSWQQNLKITDLLQSFWADLHITADLDYALVVREINVGGDISVQQFSLANALNNPNSADNLSLQPRDLILVFHYADKTGRRDSLKDYTEDQLADLISGYRNQRGSLVLTPALSRTELLNPVVEKLKLQAQHGKGRQLVQVVGEVKVPGEYPLTPGTTIQQLIAAAGGLTEAAFVNRAELARVVNSAQDGVEIQHMGVNLAEQLSGQNSLQLQSRDRLTVFPTPDWNIDQSIEIRGEVRFPGRYAIQHGETLSSVLQRAGGLNANAFAQGAIFSREDIKQRERIQVKRLADQLRADIATKTLSADGLSSSVPDAMAMINQLEQLVPAGRLVIDVPAILAGIQVADLTINNGDVLYVPRKDQTISVVGEVQSASSHRYITGMTTSDYLALAGGTRKRADAERIYVIKANGAVMMPKSAWFTANTQHIEEGDTIVVPVDTEYKDTYSLWAQVSQIAYQSAVALAALNSF